MKIGDIKDLLMIGAILYAINWVWKNRDKFDPTSEKNLAYQAANAAVQTASGGRYLTVGDWLYGMFGSNDLDPVVFSPYTKPDGTRGSRVTVVVRMRDGKRFNVDYSGTTPRLVPA